LRTSTSRFLAKRSYFQQTIVRGSNIGRILTRSWWLSIEAYDFYSNSWFVSLNQSHIFNTVSVLGSIRKVKRTHPNHLWLDYRGPWQKRCLTSNRPHHFRDIFCQIKHSYPRATYQGPVLQEGMVLNVGPYLFEAKYKASLWNPKSNMNVFFGDFTYRHSSNYIIIQLSLSSLPAYHSILSSCSRRLQT
jgi:hypothetical protein